MPSHTTYAQAIKSGARRAHPDVDLAKINHAKVVNTTTKNRIMGFRNFDVTSLPLDAAFVVSGTVADVVYWFGSPMGPALATL